MERARVGGATQAHRRRDPLAQRCALGGSERHFFNGAEDACEQRRRPARSEQPLERDLAGARGGVVGVRARACSASPARSSAGSSCSALAWPSPHACASDAPAAGALPVASSAPSTSSMSARTSSSCGRAAAAAVAASSSSSPSSAPARLSSAAPRGRSAATRSSDRQRKAALPASRCDFISWIAWRAIGSRVAACGSSARSSSAGETPAVAPSAAAELPHEARALIVREAGDVLGQPGVAVGDRGDDAPREREVALGVGDDGHRAWRAIQRGRRASWSWRTRQAPSRGRLPA